MKKHAKKNDGDMEITFDVGLKVSVETLIKNKKDAKGTASLTIGEKWKKEKATRKKELKRNKSYENEANQSAEDNIVSIASGHSSDACADDPYFNETMTERTHESTITGKSNKKATVSKNKRGKVAALVESDGVAAVEATVHVLLLKWLTIWSFHME